MRSYGRLLAFIALYLCALSLVPRITLASPHGYVYLLGPGGESDNEVYQYRQNVDGEIQLMTPPYVGTGQGVAAAAVAPSGLFLYALNDFDRTISEFRVDEDGHLKPLRKKALTAPKAFKLFISRDGAYLYALDTDSGSIYLYKIDLDGQLRHLPHGTITDKFPLSMTFDSTGKFAYVLGRSSGDIQAGINWIDGYRVNKNGSLTPLKALNIDAGYWGRQIFASASKPYIFLPCRDGLTKYRVSVTGQLVDPITTHKNASDSQVFGIMDEQFGYVVSTAAKDTSHTFPDELVVTKVESGGGLIVKNTYTMDSTGALKYGGDQYNNWQHPMAAFASLVLDPQKHIFYAIDAQSFKIFRYQINSDGTITELFPAAVTGHDPQPPNTEHMFMSFAYYDDASNYLFFVPKK